MYKTPVVFCDILLHMHTNITEQKDSCVKVISKTQGNKGFTFSN